MSLPHGLWSVLLEQDAAERHRKYSERDRDRRGEAALIVLEGSTLAVLGVHSEEYVKTLTPSSPQGHDACSVMGVRKSFDEWAADQYLRSLL